MSVQLLSLIHISYVMMAWRIAWFKVFKPLAYYAAFFSIRATAFSYETMCMGRDRLDFYLAEPVSYTHLHTMLAQEGLTGNDFSKKQL